MTDFASVGSGSRLLSAVQRRAIAPCELLDGLHAAQLLLNGPDLLLDKQWVRGVRCIAEQRRCRSVIGRIGRCAAEARE